MEKISFIDLEEKSYRNIWRISWPLMLSFLTYTLLTTADMFWIGKLGPAKVAAVAVGGSIYWVLISFEGLVSSGTVAIISRAAGSDDKELLNRGLSVSILIAFGLSFILTLCSIIYAENILNLFGLTREVLNSAVLYTRIFFIGILFMITHSSLFSTFYALGNSRIPMIISISCITLNIVLDPFLIFGWGFFPKMGIIGAAIASVFSLFFEFLITINIFFKKIEFKKFKFDMEMLISFLKIGIPALLHTLTRPVTGMIMYRITALFGTFALAAFGIGTRIIHFIFIYMDGLMIATQTLVGQYLGRNEAEKAREISFKTLRIGFIVQLFITIIIFYFADWIVYIFNSTPGVVVQGEMYLKIILVSFLFYPLTSSFGAAQRGSGDTKPLMVSAFVANWLVKIPFSLIFSIKLGMDSRGVWTALGLSVIIESIIITFFFFRGGWIRYSILEKETNR
jgi:putative MATE family efflux protein